MLVNSVQISGVTMPNPYTATRRPKKHRILLPPTVPEVGQSVPLNKNLVTQAETEAGLKSTPVTKIRWDDKTRTWLQVGRHEAGMLVFFLNVPDATHAHLVVRSIIPSKTACYAEAVC